MQDRDEMEYMSKACEIRLHQLQLSGRYNTSSAHKSDLAQENAGFSVLLSVVVFKFPACGLASSDFCL